ncbi:hypothetical protein KBD87_04200 [Candidatus Saccharibacteria bacterium]|nr:hypothetical protein [Candidatus Saccharibacteria bacterium]
MKTQKSTSGFVHVWLAVVAVVALLGVLGYVGYNALTKKGAVAQSSSQKADAAGVADCGSYYEVLKMYPSTTALNIKSKSKEVIGRINLYVTKTGGLYCAIMNSKGSAYGVTKPMSIELGSLPTSKLSGCSGYSTGYGYNTVKPRGITPLKVHRNAGSYRFYAGPVKAYEGNTRFYCSYVLGTMVYKNVKYFGWYIF